MYVIKRRANRPVRVIMKSGVILDGKEGTVAVDTKAFVRDGVNDRFSPTGEVSSGRAFYIPPMNENPSMPCQIEYMGHVYDVSDIKVYTDLRGAVQGYRMMVVGM